MPQICGLLQLLPIERPQLAAPNTPLCWIALTEPRLPLVGSALADLGLRSKVFFARGAIIKMPED